MPPAEEHLRASASRLVAALVLVASSLAIFVPSALAVPATCKVTDPKTKHVFTGSGSDLQTAIAAAAPGTNLQVKGLCVGTFTIGKKLALTGRATPSYPTPTIDAGGSGTVLTVTAGSVQLKDLSLTGGGGSSEGGGIYNAGTLTVRGSTAVTGNTADIGGGIYNAGSLTLRGPAVVTANTGLLYGAGIFNAGAATLANTASVSGNGASGAAGGIYNDLSATLSLTGSASVGGNTSGLAGGGIYNAGTLTLNGSSSVTGNTAPVGGGVANAGNGAIRSCNTWSGAISPNTPNDPPSPIPVFC